MPGTARVSYPADGVGLVLIDNPPRNFLDIALAEALERAVLEVKASGARVVVLASDVPGYFVAHMSLEEICVIFGGGTPAGDVAAIARLGRELRVGPMISIVANNGIAWGGGCELLSTANLRIAGESATFALPEATLGLLAAGCGTSRVPRLIGEARALEMMVDGRPISARKALQWGLVNRVVPDARLREETIRWAALIASRPAFAIRATKKSVGLGLDQASMRDAFKVEAEVHADVWKEHALEMLERTRAAQARYDAGGDPFAAWEFDPSDVQDVAG